MSTLTRLLVGRPYEVPELVRPYFTELIIVMRQKGTMKVMWNIRLFKGMQLLPRQVSDGDRRMDVYIKMVLVDDGKPKSYAIKVPPSNIQAKP
jgi:RanBP1 domain